jgi:hypothetical protein
MKAARVLLRATVAMALLASATISHVAVLDPATFKPLVEQFNAMATGSLWEKAR